MKKIVYIILTVSFFTSVTSLGELFKLPVLYDHFLEHQEKSHDQTFFNFLLEHYITESQNEADNPDASSDSKLPFKTNETFLSHCSPFLLTTIAFDLMITSEPAKFLEIPVAATNQFFKFIWQPPRMSS